MDDPEDDIEFCDFHGGDSRMILVRKESQRKWECPVCKRTWTEPIDSEKQLSA